MKNIPISYLTLLSRQINSAISDGYIESYSFEDIYNAIDNKNLEKIITNEVADFGILSTIQKDELEWLYQQLAYEAKNLVMLVMKELSWVLIIKNTDYPYF